MVEYYCKKCDLRTDLSECPNCHQRTELKDSSVFWCEVCKVPLYDQYCPLCGGKAKRIAADVRPVFPEERLLMEIVLGEPLKYKECSVWSSASNFYLIDGKRIDFNISDIQNIGADKVREQIAKYSSQNDYIFFDNYIDKFIRANQNRCNYITSEACFYIRKAAQGYGPTEMFVSMSGGKDSTVVSSLVRRALSSEEILHIYGDTTLEFPETKKYIEEFRRIHPKTPLLVAINKDKDFEDLCTKLGPPSRVMRWCCTVFKTGAIQRKITTLFRNKKRVLTFMGLRRNESNSRSKYDRDSNSPKITKDIQSLIVGLGMFDQDKLEIFRKIYPTLTSGSVFNPIINEDAVAVYRSVNRRLHDRYGYKGIFVIFDEFSKYIEGHAENGFAEDMKTLQDMCELCNNNSPEQLHLVCVAHKTIKSYGNSLPSAILNTFKGVEGRLKEEYFVVSSKNSYELIADAIHKTPIFEAFVGYGSRCILSDWYPIDDRYGELAIRLDSANVTFETGQDFFYDMVYSLERPYYHYMDEKSVYDLLPINFMSQIENGELGKDDLDQIAKARIEEAARKYGDDFVEYDESKKTSVIDIGNDLDMMILDMDEEDDDNPFGEEIETEDDYDEEEDVEERDQYEYADLDPEVFRDPTLLVKLLKRKDSSRDTSFSMPKPINASKRAEA